ncbi:hypothetical protein XHV734_0101 [Xanthomonas hortorum pv. vitians]|nr:hypothetical protein XHV734_0101 [Xanthomonas hortorum pv. vitians]
MPNRLPSFKHAAVIKNNLHAKKNTGPSLDGPVESESWHPSPRRGYPGCLLSVTPNSAHLGTKDALQQATVPQPST